jgi:heptaprenyl diphosphate synthase
VLSLKKPATIAVLTAFATVLHIIEAFIPNPFPIPGIKLGLANIITLLALVIFDFKTGMQIAVLRTVLGSLLSGTLLTTGFFLSFSGALTSTIFMALVLRFFPCFSLIGISVAGAAAHNIGQLAIASLIVEHAGIFFYLPVMLFSSIPTGLITGFLVKYLLQSLKSSGALDRFSF